MDESVLSGVISGHLRSMNSLFVLTSEDESCIVVNLSPFFSSTYMKFENIFSCATVVHEKCNLPPLLFHGSAFISQDSTYIVSIILFCDSLFDDVGRSELCAVFG